MKDIMKAVSYRWDRLNKVEKQFFEDLLRNNDPDSFATLRTNPQASNAFSITEDVQAYLNISGSGNQPSQEAQAPILVRLNSSKQDDKTNAFGFDEQMIADPETPDYLIPQDRKISNQEYNLRKDSTLSMSSLVKPFTKPGIPPAFMGLAASPYLRPYDKFENND